MARGTQPGGDRDVVPGLELVEVLGRGARAVVHRGRRITGPDGPAAGTRPDSTEYAVKVLRPDGDAATAAAGFVREGALLASLDHPGLARIHEVGTVGDRPYLVMELITGGSLADLLRRGPLTEARAIELVAQVAGALAAAHRAGVVHRDVKPDNIMITADGAARLIDFGLAARAGVDVGAGDDGAAGTFRYSAPEQTGTLRRPVDGRADLYALGIVLYECLTGQVPFAAADVGELLHQHLVGEIPDVRAQCPEVSPALASVVERLLAKDPDDRYRSGNGLAADLARIAAGEREPFELDLAAPPTAEPPLVGRDPQLRRLTARWERARTGEGGFALVDGPAGSGRSRLVRELAAVVRAAGQPVLVGRCLPDGAVPLAPLREAVDSYLEWADGQPPRRCREIMARVTAVAAGAAAVARTLSPRLAALLPAPVDEDEAALADRRRFVEEVAAFLTALATAHYAPDGSTGGRPAALLHVDDVQWCDQATAEVLRHLAALRPGTTLLVVATARDDVAPHGIDLAAPAEPRITLGPLDDSAVATLAVHQLGRLRIPGQLLTRLSASTGGNPLAAREYLRAVVDAGLLRPCWDAWELDEAGLVALALPDDVADLVLRRVDRLGTTARTVLTVAAVIGNHFDATVVTAVYAEGTDGVTAALADAVRYRLVEPIDGGTYRFEHDRIRAALLAEVPAERVRDLHQRVAEHLDTPAPGPADRAGPDAGRAGPDAARTYEIAGHYLRGEPTRAPQARLRALAAAGALALAQHAPAESLGYLTAAVDAARTAGVEPGTGLHTDLGWAAVRAGQYTLGGEHLTAALATETDPLRRARLHLGLAEVGTGVWDGSGALANVRRGMAELGVRHSARPGPFIVGSLLRFWSGVAIGWLPERWRLAPDERRERLRALALLAHIGAKVAVRAIKGELTVAYQMRALYWAHRLGPSRELSATYAGLAIVFMVLGLRRLGGRYSARAIAVAAALGDPRSQAHAAWMSAMAYDEYDPRATDASSGSRLARVIDEHGRYLDGDEFQTGLVVAGQILLIRGYAREAAAALDRSLAQVPSTGHPGGNPVTTVRAQATAMTGHAVGAATEIGVAERHFADRPGLRTQSTASLGITRVCLAVEQGDFDTGFDEAARRFAELKLAPQLVSGCQRIVWVHLAFGRLARAAAAGSGANTPELALAARAVRDLRRAVKGPVLRAYHVAADAYLRLLRGDARGALRRLGRLDGWAGGLDVPLLGYEVARIRARAYRTEGTPADVARQAAVAAMLAASNGWLTRLRWVRDEFDLGAEHSIEVVRGDSAWRSGTADGSHQFKRRLHALHQVSVAAATVLEPDALARVALDEVVRIFSAERAFLFLHRDHLDGSTVDGPAVEGPDPDRPPADLGGLVPYLGRDQGGADIRQLTGYGSTLVRSVAESGEALVVTGSEEGVALGSMSTMVHGLRSIMVAPLTFKGHVRGVVYLDSRVAKGIFTGDDVDILAALTNQVAIALETARAAQLDREIHTAHRQRDLAETLRQTMADLTGTLDPAEVGDRLLTALAHSIPVDSAVLLQREPGRPGPDGPHTAGGGWKDGRPVVTATHGAVPAEPDAGGLAPQVWATADPTRGDGPAPLPGLGAGPWLAVPMVSRGEHRGLVLAVRAGRPFGDAEAEIAAALAGQGAVALENADLFSQVRGLAERDALTGLYNRRRFAELADRHLNRSPVVAAVMVDIDHFKKINDTHGHGVGDQVIRVVAQRLARSLRGSDIICRYGGEEFAVLLPDTTPPIAQRVADRLHQAVTASAVATDAGELPVTVSVGLVGARPENSDLAGMLNHADEALYRAKRGGRNQVCAV